MEFWGKEKGKANQKYEKPSQAPFLPLFPFWPVGVAHLFPPLSSSSRGLAPRSRRSKVQRRFHPPLSFLLIGGWDSEGSFIVPTKYRPSRHGGAQRAGPVMVVPVLGKTKRGALSTPPPSHPILRSPSPMFPYSMATATESSWHWIPTGAMNEGLSSSGQARTGPWLGHDNTSRLPTHRLAP
jgi:hypothetical protein